MMVSGDHRQYRWDDVWSDNDFEIRHPVPSEIRPVSESRKCIQLCNLTMAGSAAPTLSPVDPNQVYALVRSCADQSDYVRYQRDQKTLTELFAHPGESVHYRPTIN